MSDRTGRSIEDRVVALLKANHRDLRSFVRAVEALVPVGADVAAFLDEMGAMLASDDRNVGAMEVWDRAARLYEEQTRLEELAELYANMGPVAATMGDLPRGIRFSLKAEELSSQLEPDPELTYHVSSDLGAMYAELGDWEHAMYEDSRALEVSRTTDDYTGQIGALLALAQVSIARGDLDAARSEAMGALSLSHFHADACLEADSLRAVGDVSEASGEHEQAIRQYQQGLTLEATAPDPEIRAQLHYGLSVAYDALGESAKAAKERNLTEEAGLPGDAEDDNGDD
jgi:tetratricopeptide (TPR) repeat protein